MALPKPPEISFSPQQEIFAVPLFEKCARLARRMPGDTIGPLRLITASLGSFSAEVNDISVLGIGLIVATEYPVGSLFVIEAGPHERKLSHALEAVQHHATQRADGLWILGCSFSRLLTIDDVEALG